MVFFGKKKNGKKNQREKTSPALQKPHIEETNGHETKLNVVSLLQELQAEHGFLPAEEMIALSKRLKVPGVNIFGVATFYSQFKLSKPGKYIVSVCSGTACHIKNSGELLKHAEQVLGIKRGQTTSDGKITLETVNCLGACAKAPAMMINDVVYGELSKEKLKKILEGLK